MQSSDAPNKISIAFARDGDKRPIPNTSQIGVINGAASYPTGFPPLTFIKKTDGGIPPDGEDFNGVFYDITAIQRWQSAGGLFKFDASLATAIGGYPKGAFLLRADGLGTWQNSVENNSSNPDTGGAGWFSNSAEMTTYTALRSYTGGAGSVIVTGAGIAGTFVRGTGIDNGGTVFVATNGVVWVRVYSGPVDVRWWEAKFDNVTDDTAAIQACINYAQPLQKQIWFPEGTAKITAQLQVAFSLFGLNIIGQGYAKTRINYANIFPLAAAAINIIGHSGSLCGAVIDGVGFDGNSSSTAIVIAGQDGQRVLNCQFGLNFFGLVFRNNAAGSFTEYSVAENCSFLRNCASALWYNVVGSGDVSFHGSGLFRCQVETPDTPGYRSIVVDPSAFPYNAPMDVQVWSNEAGVFIDASTRTIDATPYFVGDITTEAFVGPLVLANSPVGREIPLVGNVCGNTESFEMGSLFLVNSVVANASGTRQTVGGRVSKQQALTTGANAVVGIPLCIVNGAVNYTVNINGPNYNYRMLVSAFSKENSGLAPVLATFATFNSAGWGAPTFSIDPTTSALVITNAAYPASGVTATIEAEQIGQSIYDPFFK